MKILTLLNEKGGVGKTTLAVHIAAGLALRGLRVLLLDSCPQHNATTAVGLPKADGLYRLLIKEAEWRDLLRQPDPARLTASGTLAGSLFVLPGNHETAAIPVLQDDITILHSRLRELEGYVDVAVIDTAPTLSMLHSMIYVASDGLLYPTQCEQWSLEGLRESVAHMKRVAAMRKLVAGQPTQVVGVLPTQVDRQTLAHRHGLKLLRQRFGKLIFEPQPLRTVWKQAGFVGQTIYAYEPQGEAAQIMRRAVSRIAERWIERTPHVTQ